jgi:hypothetical protein
MNQIVFHFSSVFLKKSSDQEVFCCLMIITVEWAVKGQPQLRTVHHPSLSSCNWEYPTAKTLLVTSFQCIKMFDTRRKIDSYGPFCASRSRRQLGLWFEGKLRFC